MNRNRLFVISVSSSFFVLLFFAPGIGAGVGRMDGRLVLLFL